MAAKPPTAERNKSRYIIHTAVIPLSEPSNRFVESLHWRQEQLSPPASEQLENGKLQKIKSTYVPYCLSQT